MVRNTEVRARSRAQLVAASVHVERGGRPVLVDVSVSVSAGTRLGVVGENGRGKSTLLHVLAGTLRPDSGTVSRIGSIGVAEQELAAGDARTVGELIDVELADARAALQALDEAAAAMAAEVEGADDEYAAALDAATALDAWDADRRVDLALDALGAVRDRSRALAQMSVGERYRVRLACLLGAQHDFLLLDEPTNHLDEHGLDFLTAALRDHPGGVVLVSHDRVLLADVVTKILDLDPSIDGRPRVYGDGYEGYRAGRAAAMARWEQDYDQHLAEEARLADDLSAAQNRLRSGWRPPKGGEPTDRRPRRPRRIETGGAAAVPHARTGNAVRRDARASRGGRGRRPAHGSGHRRARIRRPSPDHRSERGRQVHPARGACRTARSGPGLGEGRGERPHRHRRPGDPVS